MRLLNPGVAGRVSRTERQAAVPRDEFVGAVLEIGVFLLRKRHLPDKLDDHGALLEELGDSVALLAHQNAHARRGDLGIAEREVLFGGGPQHLRADALGGADRTHDLPTAQTAIGR